MCTDYTTTVTPTTQMPTTAEQPSNETSVLTDAITQDTAATNTITPTSDTTDTTTLTTDATETTAPTVIGATGAGSITTSFSTAVTILFVAVTALLLY